MNAFERLGLTPDILATAARTALSHTQDQTRETFGFKWTQRDTFESEAMQAKAKNWLLEKYCGGDAAQLDTWLSPAPQLILDAGCGAALSALAFLGDRLRQHQYLGADISADAVEVARTRFAERDIPGCFLACDLMQLPLPPESVDLIFSEGVLHHTDNTAAAIKSLATLLRPGGRFLFYVYCKKAPLREFADDHIREALAPLSDKEAWEALKPLTKLGIALGELNAEIDVPDDIPYLGIQKGTHNIQRLFYYTILKAFYAPDFNLEEMNHINFDWYRPSNCHRQTPDEVRTFCNEAHLKIERLDASASGIAVVAIKQ